MSGIVPGAALPWAVSDAAHAPAAHSAEEQLSQQPLSVEALGLALGSRIEVRWEIIPAEDEGRPFSKWWGASISSQAAAAADAPGPCYKLSYDPDESFEAEERRVQLTSEHELFDLEDEDTLMWRREGEDWEPSTTATLGDIMGGLPDEAELREAEEEALADLDPATQRRVAAGFRDLAESFKEYMREKLEAAAAAGTADTFVVTEGMVAEFKATYGARLQRDQASGGA